MKRRLLLGSPVLLTGCGSLLPSQSYTPRVSWPLTPTPAQNLPSAPDGPVLLVRDIAAAPGLDARGLQTLRTDGTLQTDYYNNWAVPPADAVTQALVAWAEGAGIFSAIVAPGSRLAPNFILEGELTGLLADAGAGVARASLTLTLLRANAALGATARPLAQARLAGTAPLTGATPAAQVAAQTQALSAVLTQAMALLAAHEAA